MSLDQKFRFHGCLSFLCHFWLVCLLSHILSSLRLFVPQAETSEAADCSLLSLMLSKIEIHLRSRLCSQSCYSLLRYVLTLCSLSDRPHRKKRVSFSERLVQERSFRPNSSILGQKKKNQRKQRNKMKKRHSATSEEEFSNDDEGRMRSDSETVRFY